MIHIFLIRNHDIEPDTSLACIDLPYISDIDENQKNEIIKIS